MTETEPERTTPERIAGVIARNVALRRQEQRLSFEAAGAPGRRQQGA